MLCVLVCVWSTVSNYPRSGQLQLASVYELEPIDVDAIEKEKAVAKPWAMGRKLMKE